MGYQQLLPGRSSASGINSPLGDTTFTKLFVGGLAWETHSDAVGRYFQQFGHILEAVVISDKNTRRSKGYGFVTFQEPEAASRACADPNPIIDGRRANCNLASLRHPRPPINYGRPIMPSSSPYVGSMQPPRGAYIGGFQQPLPFNYQQGVMFPPYGYATYGPEYVYPQGSPNAYTGQQYLQIYGVPGYPYPQLGQNIPGGQGYPTIHGYTMPAQQVIQYGGHSVNAVITTPVPTIQTPYPTGLLIKT